MRIVFANIIEAVAASAEDANFPVQNLLEPHSRKRYRAGAQSATVSATMGGGSNCLALYNIQADSVSVEVTGSDSSLLLSQSIDLVRDDGWGEYRAEAVFLEYSLDAAVHSASVALDAATMDVALGILYGGRAHAFTNPEWGMGNNPKSHSILYDLDNGYEYVFQRNMSKAPSFTVKMRDRNQYHNFLRLSQDAYPRPVVMKMDHMLPGEEHNFIWYARMDGPPKGSLSRYGSYTVSFGLKEFL
jgi:hypothetical protein